MAVAFIAAFAAVLGCGSDFSPKNAVTGVRILAARADRPYAKPGDTVQIEALVHDGRKAPATPMRLFWFPLPCVNPPADLYWACYPLFEAAFPLGVDLTPSLVESKQATITIPTDALARAVKVPGQQEPYATAYVFMVACAGHVERVARRSDRAPNALPIGCFDAGGNPVAADDFVVGYTRVFVFGSRTNTIPTLDGVSFEGNPVDPKAGIVTSRCIEDDKSGDCKTVKLDVAFADGASEIDPDNVGPEGQVGRETIYVDWFTTVGKFQTDRKIVFDGNLGRPPKTAIEFSPPNDPIKGTVWAILHDNRGGTSWLELPIEIQ